MAATAIRGKDWVFNAFWAACGEPTAPKCSMEIPVTFIFKNGKPIKIIRTDVRGFLERVALEEVVLERTETERGLRGEMFKSLRVLRQLLFKYREEKGYPNEAYDDDESRNYFCKVRSNRFI